MERQADGDLHRSFMNEPLTDSRWLDFEGPNHLYGGFALHRGQTNGTLPPERSFTEHPQKAGLDGKETVRL